MDRYTLVKLTKTLKNWLNANKSWLNISKTQVVLFKSSRKLTDAPWKLKLKRKRLYPTNSVKYLGINVDENFNWKQQIYDIFIKLNRENVILSQVRHFIDRETLKSVYHAILEPHLCYSSLAWAQNLNPIKRLFVFQKKIPYGLYIFEIIIFIRLPYSENSTF